MDVRVLLTTIFQRQKIVVKDYNNISTTKVCRQGFHNKKFVVSGCKGSTNDNISTTKNCRQGFQRQKNCCLGFHIKKIVLHEQ